MAIPERPLSDFGSPLATISGRVSVEMSGSSSGVFGRLHADFRTPPWRFRDASAAILGRTIGDRSVSCVGSKVFSSIPEHVSGINSWRQQHSQFPKITEAPAVTQEYRSLGLSEVAAAAAVPYNLSDRRPHVPL